MAQLHTKEISKCCNLVIKRLLRRLILILVSNFEYSLYLTADHNWIVKDLSKAFNISDCLQ